MQLHWWDLVQPLVAGLGGILGMYAADDVLKSLRRRGIIFGSRRS